MSAIMFADHILSVFPLSSTPRGYLKMKKKRKYTKKYYVIFANNIGAITFP